MPTASNKGNQMGGASWTNFYAARPGLDSDQDIVTAPGSSGAMVGGAVGGVRAQSAGAPFAWLGMMLLLAMLYVAIRAGAKLSAG